jgi:O-antigen/teichoic acid export membrane protein
LVSLLRAAWGTHALALADQAVVSGTSFITTIVIGRWCLPSELGVYSLGISLLVSWLAIQESLISLPYVIYRQRPLQGTPPEHAGSSLAHNGLLSVLAIAVLMVTAMGLSARGAEPKLAAVTWALAGVVPFALLREFGRRFAFAHLHVARSLMLDLAVAAIQLAGLGWLAWTGRLSATTACAAIGAACALAGGAWLYLARGNFAFRADQVRATMEKSWRLGKWLFASQLTLSVQGYITYWLLAWVAGTAATGVYAACMSVVLFSNPFTMGISNILAPKAALALHEGGGARLQREVIRDSLLLGAAMALFCALVLLAGEEVIRLAYHGKEYDGHGHTVVVLALALLASAVGFPASNALACMERPRAIFWAGLFAVVVTVGLVYWLVVKWGLVGAAYGFLAGNVAGSVGRWIAFLALVPRFGPKADRMGSDSNSAMVIRVIQQCTQSSKDSGWVVEQLNEGCQAIVYAVRSQNRQPAWQTDRSFVVKLYKPAAAPTIELVRTQFEALTRLHASVNGRIINGWKISAPAALYVCESPLALVMTMVPGRKLNSCLDTGENVTPEMLESASHAVVTVMERYWWIDSQLHGDLNFDNILCDIVGRDLSFVDLGALENCFFYDGVTKRWYPSSYDLAYMLFDTGVAVKNTIGRPGALLRRQMFAHGVLRAFILTIGPFEEKQRMLDEIHACAREHLKTLDLSWSPRGLWCVLLKQIASRRIDAMLGRLKAELKSCATGSVTLLDEAPNKSHGAHESDDHGHGFVASVHGDVLNGGAFGEGFADILVGQQILGNKHAGTT